MIPAARMPGRGDADTWGPCTGHPHDPRTPEPDPDEITRDIAEDTVLADPVVSLHELTEAAESATLTHERIEAVIADPTSATGPELLAVLLQDWPWSKHQAREVEAVRRALRSWVLARVRSEVDAMAPEGGWW